MIERILIGVIILCIVGFIAWSDIKIPPEELKKIKEKKKKNK